MIERQDILRTDNLDMTWPGARWLLNISINLPIANFFAIHATKTPYLVTAKVGHENLISVRIGLGEKEVWEIIISDHWIGGFK